MYCWTLHLSGGPLKFPPEMEITAGVVVGDKVYSFVCDEDNMDQMTVHVFNTVSLCWRTLPPGTPGRGEHQVEVPSQCLGFSVVLVEDVIYLWGGMQMYSDDFCNLLYAFDVDSHRWFNPRVSGTIPEGRSKHSACVFGKVMYIHGGLTKLTGWITNDIYKLDTATMVWSLINTRGTTPPASSFNCATIIGTKMFLFGRNGDQNYNHTIGVFDTETDCWLNTTSAQLLPEAIYNTYFFTYNGEMYILGGRTGNYTPSDLWKLNPETLSGRKVEPNGKGPSRMYFGMCCCRVGDRIVIFGGEGLHILDLSPSLKTLCKLAVIQHDLEQAGLTHDVRWELAAMTTNRNRQ